EREYSWLGTSFIDQVTVALPHCQTKRVGKLASARAPAALNSESAAIPIRNRFFTSTLDGCRSYRAPIRRGCTAITHLIALMPAVATSREGHRLPRSGREVQLQHLGLAR